MLTSLQKIGLKYHEDLQKRVPRDEAEKILEKVEKAAKKIFKGDNLKLEICGSYRRGKPDTGDIDILVTRNDNKDIKGMLEKLVKELEK